MAYACAFSGHRRIENSHVESVVEHLARAIKYSYDDGCRDFYSGGAIGFDTIAALCVLELKEKISGSAITALPTAGGRAAPVRMSGKLSEAAEALVGLGFNRAEVTDVIRTLDTTNMTREDIVTAALKRFAKPQ